MKLQYLRAFIVLLAGLITLIINIRSHKDVTISLLILLIVIIVFYLIATFLVEILQHSLEQNKKIEQIQIIEEESKENEVIESEKDLKATEEMVQTSFDEFDEE